MNGGGSSNLTCERHVWEGKSGVVGKREKERKERERERERIKKGEAGRKEARNLRRSYTIFIVSFKRSLTSRSCLDSNEDYFRYSSNYYLFANIYILRHTDRDANAVECVL